jgi:subtilisin-like proprotein convertase family protein
VDERRPRAVGRRVCRRRGRHPRRNQPTEKVGFGATLSRSLSITTALNVETVEVTVDVTHAYRGDLEFTLTGPSGVQSILGTVRSQDDGDNFANWTFSSVRH